MRSEIVPAPALRVATLATVLSIGGCANRPPIVNTHDMDPDREGLVGWYVSWDGDCQSALTRIRVIERPGHGRIDIRNGSRTIGSGATLGRNIGCEGSTVASKEVYYIPDAGFTGSDSLLFEISRPNAAGSQPYRMMLKVR